MPWATVRSRVGFFELMKRRRPSRYPTVSAADMKGVQLTRKNLAEDKKTARILIAGGDGDLKRKWKWKKKQKENKQKDKRNR
jgi:hypothetical protein